MGGQPLYSLHTSLTQAGAAPDTESETFGIRTVTSSLIGPAPSAPKGSRQFKINGVPFVIRGGGWSEDLFLHYSAADTAKQIALMKNLGLNTIRSRASRCPTTSTSRWTAPASWSTPATSAATPGSSRTAA